MILVCQFQPEIMCWNFGTLYLYCRLVRISSFLNFISLIYVMNAGYIFSYVMNAGHVFIYVMNAGHIFSYVMNAGNIMSCDVNAGILLVTNNHVIIYIYMYICILCNNQV